MKMRMKLFEFRRQLISGTLAESQPQLALLLNWALNFVLGMILAAVPLFGRCGPFGIAIAAQAGAGLGGLMCALGASCGYLAFFGFQPGIKYVAAVVLIFAAGFSTQELKLHHRSFFMPAIAAFFTLLTCFLGYVTSEAGKSMVLPLILETVLAFGCTYFYHEALCFDQRTTDAAELRHGIALMILLAGVLMALSRTEYAGVLSLGRVAAILLVQIAACGSGSLSGAAAGLVLGLAMDVTSGNPGFYAAAYAFSALISGVFWRHGRLVFLLSYTLCGALSVICGAQNGLRLELLYENFVASVIFMVLPGKAIRHLSAYLKSVQVSTGEAGLRRYTARRLRQMSVAMNDLYTTVDSTLSAQCNDDNIARIFDRASEQVCSHCKNKAACWNRNYMDTLTVFNDVSALIRSRGSLRTEDLPQHFTEQCLKPEELVGAVNGELRGQLYRKRYQARLAENRTAAYAQYQDLAEILADVSEELENAYGPDPLAQRRLSRYLSTMDLDADLSVFRDRSGRLHVLLESAKLKRLMQEPGYLDRLSEAVGVRLCRPMGRDENAEGRITLMEAEPLSVSVGVASMKKSGETVSGDRGTYFKTEQGVLCVILSDGMGSGENAARESVAAVRILERFLRAGVNPAAAMRMLNSVMLLKNVDEWGFATVDLLCIDLFSGEASFYKYGAAPSYVKAGKQIRRVRSESLAAGLSAAARAEPDTVCMRLRPGCLAVIASDGILAETDDAWMRTLISEYNDTDMKSMAREILQTAIKKYGSTDDMTVLSVRVEKRA